MANKKPREIKASMAKYSVEDTIKGLVIHKTYGARFDPDFVDSVVAKLRAGEKLFQIAKRFRGIMIDEEHEALKEWDELEGIMTRLEEE
ncbi:MAG: hypothetical protein WC455_17775 [Dehalococcoidia bacterium]|jgi:hypothetical protein